MKKKLIRDFAPDSTNFRNSEGDFIRLSDGRIMFVYTRYGKGDGDGDSADLYAAFSSDNGDSFSDGTLIFPRERVEADNIMSVTLRRMKNGDIGMYFLKKSPVCQCRMYLTRSADDGKTWSEPVACIKHCGYFVVNNDRVITASSGRIIIPAAYTQVLTDAETGDTSFGRAAAFFYASDDDGYTWNKIGECHAGAGFAKSHTGLQEPGLIELENGVLKCYFRTDTGKQFESFSFDGGESWSEVQPSDFTSPTSPISVKRLSDGRLIHVWNPVPLYNGRSERPFGVWTGARNPLVCKVGDECFTIEDDESRGFAYTAVFQCAENEILLGYCAGGSEDKAMLNRLRITKLYL